MIQTILIESNCCQILCWIPIFYWSNRPYFVQSMFFCLYQHNYAHGCVNIYMQVYSSHSTFAHSQLSLEPNEPPSNYIQMQMRKSKFIFVEGRFKVAELILKLETVSSKMFLLLFLWYLPVNWFWLDQSISLPGSAEGVKLFDDLNVHPGVSRINYYYFVIAVSKFMLMR